MSNDYRIESISIGQYLKAVKKEDIKTDQAVQRDFCWNSEMMNALIYSALSRKIYIPTIILAEENRSNGTKQKYVVDGGQRTETLYRFREQGYKITRNLRNYMIPYNKKKVDENGNYIRNEYGDIELETEMFDIRNKRFEDFPEELQDSFDNCPLTTAIYQDCATEETSEYVMLYNNHTGMNVSQKSLTYIGKFAEEIKRIKDTNIFLKDGAALTENEKSKGFWERVISECVMAIFHFENWKKTPKSMCDYLNSNSSVDEYKTIEKYFNRLIPYVDKLENKKVSDLFSSKNMFIWMMLFDRFDKLNIPDEMFGEFLNAFVSELSEKKINGENWTEIDADKHTKDRSVITRKVEYLETLMNEFLHIDEIKNITPESFIAEMVDMPVEEVRDELECYEDTLSDLQNSYIRVGSKLLDVANRLSLLAMVAYSYKNDVDLDDWLAEYAANNNTYHVNQRKNFLHMLNDFTKGEKRNAGSY